MLITYENIPVFPVFQSDRISDIEKIIKYRSFQFGKENKSLQIKKENAY